MNLYYWFINCFSPEAKKVKKIKKVKSEKSVSNLVRVWEDYGYWQTDIEDIIQCAYYIYLNKETGIHELTTTGPNAEKHAVYKLAVFQLNLMNKVLHEN
jgi:hypothetical protein